MPFCTLRCVVWRDVRFLRTGVTFFAWVALAAMVTAPAVTFWVISSAGFPEISWSLTASPWQKLLPGFVALWLCGVVAFSIRLLAGWRFTARLQSTSHPAPAEWQRMLTEIGTRAGTSRHVRLLVSSMVDVPAVIGWLRPAILVPVECLTGMPVEHFTALLAHEMAHIRRNDYLASIVQSVAEAVLFYHPAVWWVSGQIRAEREACCDDLAVESCGDVLTYARALAALESIQQPRLTTALAANGGSLIRRIRRLVDPAQAVSENLPGAGAAWAMALLLVAGIGVSALHAAQTPVTVPHLNSIAQMPGPSPFALPPVPADGIADHARKTLLFDPFLSAQLTQPAAQVSAAEAPATSPWHQWLDGDVAYIITPGERDAFLKLTTEEERQQFVEQFWLGRDPTPGTEENEFKEEHYRRIAYANEHFGEGIPGWKTDRGRVYIVLGPPDQITGYQKWADGSVSAWAWTYGDVRFMFDDLPGTGEFRMTANHPDIPTLVAQSAGRKGQTPGVSFASLLYTAMFDRAIQNRLPLNVRFDYFRGTPSAVLVNLTLQFEDKDLQFQPVNGANRSVVNMFGRVTSMTRRPISTFEPTLESDLPFGVSTEHLKQVYQQSIPLQPGRYHVDIVAKDVVSGNMNVYESALDVPVFEENKLSTSSLVLADSIEKLPAKPTGGAMFAIGDDKVRPRADNVFSSAEKMGAYLQAYNFSADDRTQLPVGTVEYEIENADSRAKVLDVFEDIAAMQNASASQVTIRKLLPLNTFAPGNYVLSVLVTDKKTNQMVRQQEHFTVRAE